MNTTDKFHFVTTGTSVRMIRNLWSRIAHRGSYRISHIVHPTYDRDSWVEMPGCGDVYFLRDRYDVPLPAADETLLESLEGDGVPTIHNMIMSDRCVSRLDYGDALRYATYLTRRLMSLYEQVKPSAIIGGFDALHGSLEMAVARQMGIPWFAPNFSVLPSGLAAFCTGLSPATAVVFEPHRKKHLQARAEELLRDFEVRRIKAPAYVPPPLLSPIRTLQRIASPASVIFPVLRRRRHREGLKYTDRVFTFSVRAQIREIVRLRKNLWHLRGRSLLESAPKRRYAFIGLHMQPESSIDVFAHFFANQVRVIELISRALPPTVALLVKLHKSDAPNYSKAWLDSLEQFPGVTLVSPGADSIELIRNAALVVAIQGTIGLEAALFGKPVILFGDSPAKVFPSVSTVGRTVDLPDLVRQKLAERPPSRSQIVDAYASYLTPFYPASMNDWSLVPTDAQIDEYVDLFSRLRFHVEGSCRQEPSNARVARGAGT